MSAIETRIARLETTTSRTERFVCLAKDDDDESDADCIPRHGYADKPWVIVLPINTQDQKL